MKSFKRLVILLSFLILLFLKLIYAGIGIKENFDSGNWPDAFASYGWVSMPSGNWFTFTNAIDGNLPQDNPRGVRCLRIRAPTGSHPAWFMSPTNKSASTVTFHYKRYGSDGGVVVRVEYWTNGVWQQLGSTFDTTGVSNWTPWYATINTTNRVVIRFVYVSGSSGNRWNFDDFYLFDFVPGRLKIIANSSGPLNDGVVNRSGSYINTTGTYYDVGIYRGIGERAFMSFNLGNIPPNALITSATLYIHQWSQRTNNTDPKYWPSVGRMVVDNVDYGNTFEASDFNCTVISSNIGIILQTNFPVQQWGKLDVKDAIQYCINNPKSWNVGGTNRYAQFRLRLLNDDDTGNTNDYRTSRINSANYSDGVYGPFIEVCYFLISITKSISNVKLGGVNSTAIPGATITYKITYTNSGSGSGNQIIIYDRIPPQVTYYTQTNWTTTGWTNQFSTNINPDLSWNSLDWVNNPPASKSNIKWIRWKKLTVSPYEKGSITFKVIIK